MIAKTTRVQALEVPSDLQAEWDRLKNMSDGELDKELAATLEVSAAHLVKLALIVRQKEERGHDLSDLKIGMIGYLRRIAYGQVVPEVVARFGAAPNLLRKVAALPIPDQKRCLSPKGIPVGEMSGDRVTHRLVDPLTMRRGEIQQVFAPDHIREPEAQIAWMRSQPLPSHRARQQVEVDVKRGAIVITGDGVRLTRAELLTYLARLG